MTTAMIESAEEISSEEYHKLPGVSNSRLSVFIEDPRLYFYQFLSGQYVEEQKDHFDFGHAVHEISLLGMCNVEVIPLEVLTKDGKRAGNAWKAYATENAGKMLMKSQDYRAVMRCVEEIQKHPIAGALLAAPGHAEKMYSATIDGMLFRCKPDKICTWNGKTIVVDLKTTTDTTPNKFVKSIERFGYHRQEYFYRRVLEANQIDVDAFVFIAVNDSEPHCVDCYELDKEWLDYAVQEAEPALQDLRRRTVENDWKSATENSVIRVSPPNYMRFKGQYSL
jgi:exodeoxyribonuclease VIII